MQLGIGGRAIGRLAFLDTTTKTAHSYHKTFARPPAKRFTSSLSASTPAPAPAPAVSVMDHSRLNHILPALRAIVPPLSQHKHKGQAGRIAVIGGCREYTGAPFFSALSALKLGADLSHVFCTQGAALVIKSYSPELIVHPILEESYDLKGDANESINRILKEIEKWIQKFDCLVIGPGLGRDKFLLECVTEIMRSARKKNIPMVLDADGLFLVAQMPELVFDYPLAILTPNVNEYKHLVAAVMGKDSKVLDNLHKVPEDDMHGQFKELAERMGGLTILQKGKTDLISDGCSVFASDFYGSPRRCGGQGDVLSGSVAVFVSWASEFFGEEEKADQKKLLEERISKNPVVIGAVAASLVVRLAAMEAFTVHKRSMVTMNIIEVLGSSMEELFPV